MAYSVLLRSQVSAKDRPISPTSTEMTRLAPTPNIVVLTKQRTKLKTVAATIENFGNTIPRRLRVGIVGGRDDGTVPQSAHRAASWNGFCRRPHIKYQCVTGDSRNALNNDGSDNGGIALRTG